MRGLETTKFYYRRFKFPKEEKLTSKKLIQKLFKEGDHFFIFPFKVFYMPDHNIFNNQVLLTVSKKKFKKAVKRNRIKRQMREAYRLNRHNLDNASPLLMAFIYVHTYEIAYHLMEKKIILCFQRINKKIQINN